MTAHEEIVRMVYDLLQIDTEKVQLVSKTPLLGVIPEFDSVAVVTLLTNIEERFGILVDDDEVDATIFESIGTLVAFVESKL